MSDKTSSKSNSTSDKNQKENESGSMLSNIISLTPQIIEKVLDNFSESNESEKTDNSLIPSDNNENHPSTEETAISVTAEKPGTALSTTTNGKSIWSEIGCSPRTEKYIVLSLADGVIDSQEQKMLEKCANDDGVDIQELNFLLSKALESQQLIHRDAIKQLARAFEIAEKMSNDEIKPDSSILINALPDILKSARTACEIGGKTGNPYVAGATAITSLVGTFINEPSKLNEFKAEIIRKIEIPMLPEVLVDFFTFANSEIQQDKQKAEGKGFFSLCSDFLFRKELRLGPIWQEKINGVMTKALSRFGHDRNVMTMLYPYRCPTPLDILTSDELTNDDIAAFQIPNYPCDFIDTLRFVFTKSQEIDSPARDAFYNLYQRMRADGAALGEKYPQVEEALRQFRITPLDDLKVNCSDPDYLAMFNLPDDFEDTLEVFRFLASRKDLKPLHKRLFKQASTLYADDPDALNSIKEFKPKNIFGF